MAVVFNFYSDPACTNPVLYPGAGSVYIPTDSPYASISGWTQRQGNVYSAYINRAAGIVLSAPAIYDARFPTSKIYDTNPEIVDGNMKNAFFVSANNVYGGLDASYYMQIIAQMELNGTTADITLRFGAYTTANKTYHTSGAPSAVVTAIVATVAASQFAGVRAATCNISGRDYIMLAAGVSDTGEFPPNSTAAVLLIDREYFKTNIPKPYVGPVSKDSAATSFTPTTPYHDSIAGRDLTGKRNPIGFNSGNGLRLLQLDNAGYSQILYGIYSGSSSSLLNYAGQLIDQVTGGEGHRPAEEVQPMTQGVLCCHIVPAIATYGSGIYNLKSIAGYRLSLAGVPGLLCAQHIYSYTSPAVSVAPRLNSFLDYEPYTSIICHLPFFGDISVSPSALLGNAIQAEYELDIYTGILSCNLFIITPDNRYIISTQQSKISTDLPVIGSAANQNAIGTIAQATGGLARARMQQARAQEIGTQAEQAAAAANTAASAAAGAVTTVDALSRAGNAVPVGGSSVEGIGNYLVSRAAYLIITRPQPSLPENFAQLYGAVSNISGTVSSFSGYTEFAAVDLRGIDATDAEKAQILALLRGGVFI